MGEEHGKFNECSIIYIMYIDNKPVLHIVDKGTRFRAVRFLSTVYTEYIWKYICYFWAAVYTDLPNKIITYQGSQFGDKFIQMACIYDDGVEKTGFEAHSSLILGKTVP